MKFRSISVFATILILALVLAATSGCSKIERLKVGSVRNVSFKGMENNAINLEVTVPIENPNSFKLKIKNADMKLTSNGTEIGRIKQINDLVIAGKSTKEYPVNVTVELTNLNGGLLSAMRFFNSKTDLRMNGTVKVRSFIYAKTVKVEDYKLVR
ncbi:MAG: LEA type 2 family protein [Bacteroidota bacterium]|nr:LEA type 2 family protein [Bacteroidota bacterium]